MPESRPALISGRRARNSLVLAALVFTFLACEGKGPPDPNPGRHAESYGRAIAEETVVIARDHLLTHPDHPRQRQAREQLLRFQDLVEPEPSDQR